MHARLALLLACACLSWACLVATLQPVYDDGSLATDQTLVGTWRSDDPAATIVIERGEWKAYRVVYTVRTTAYAMVAYLTRIGDDLYVDLTAEHGVGEMPLMAPVHAVARLQHAGDTITIAPLDYDYFVAALGGRHLERLDGATDARQNVLLTSPTPALRAWLLANAKNAAAFHEPITLSRGH